MSADILNAVAAAGQSGSSTMPTPLSIIQAGYAVGKAAFDIYNAYKNAENMRDAAKSMVEAAEYAKTSAKLKEEFSRQVLIDNERQDMIRDDKSATYIRLAIGAGLVALVSSL